MSGFYTKEQFQKDIQALIELHDCTHLEAMMLFCQEKKVDTEDILPLMTPYLKNKLFIDGMSCGILKKEPTVSELFK